MRKKDYQKPTAEVVRLSQGQSLLAGSTGGGSVQNYTWQDVLEE